MFIRTGQRRVSVVGPIDTSSTTSTTYHQTRVSLDRAPRGIRRARGPSNGRWLCRLGWAAVDVSLFLSQLGYCITYLIFVARNVGPLVKDRLPDDWSWLARTNSLIMLQVRLPWRRAIRAHDDDVVLPVSLVDVFPGWPWFVGLFWGGGADRGWVDVWGRLFRRQGCRVTFSLSSYVIGILWLAVKAVMLFIVIDHFVGVCVY